MRGKNLGYLMKSMCLAGFLPVILAAMPVFAETTYSDSTPINRTGQKRADASPKKEAADPVLVDVETENARLAGRSESAEAAGHAIGDYRVRQVHIRGNKIVPSSAIMKKVQTLKDGPLIVETVQGDIQEILAMGWFSDVRVEFLETAQGVDVSYIVEENPCFYRLELLGSTRINLERFMHNLGLAPGELVNTEIVNRQLEQIIGQYRNAGYTVARIRDVSLTEDGVLTVLIDEGIIENISVAGNKKVRKNVILREMRFKPGDPFNVNAARRSLQRLNNLGYFNGTRMRLRPGKEPSKIEVVVEVEEHGTATVGVGVGHSESNGMVGTLTLEDTDFLGLGDDAKIQWEVGKKSKSNYLISYTKPWLDKKETTAQFVIYGNTQEYAEYNRGAYEIGRYDKKAQGQEITFSRAAGEYARNYVTLKRRKDSYVKPISGYEPQYYEESYNDRYFNDFGVRTTAAERRKQNFGETRSITFAHIYDSRDYIFNPHGGKYRSFSVEWAGLGGDFKFTKYTTEFRYYIPQGPNTIAFDLMAGYADGNMPLSQRFSMGGANLRGYKDDQFQGNSMLKGTVEYRFPISKKITGLVFLDSGYAWDKRDEKKFDLDKIKFGYGVGVRFWSPIGPVMLDYGIGDERKRFHFNFGYQF